MDNQVRVGVVGAGLIVDALHVPSLKSHPAALVSAICSRTQKHASSVAKKHNIPDVYTDYRVMIKEANLDAIVIATPDDLHYPMTMAALDAGLHVLCEKPLALTVAQAGEMAEKANSTGLKNMIFCTNRWRPHCRYLKELLDQEFIGHPYHIYLSFLGGYGREPVYKWRFDTNRANGILGDLGSHLIDLARWYMGDIVKVSALLGSFVKRLDPNGEEHNPANDSAMLLLEFENGVHGIIQTSAVAYTANRFNEHHIRVHGSEGTLEVDHTMEGTDWSTMTAKTVIGLRGAQLKDSSFKNISHSRTSLGKRGSN